MNLKREKETRDLAKCLQREKNKLSPLKDRHSI